MSDQNENNANNKVNPGYFGPGVIGSDLHAQEQAVVERQADVFGPGVVGLPAGPVNKAGPGVTDQGPGQQAGDDKKADVPSLSIEKLEEALDENPALVDTLLPAELARTPGPRKGALIALEIAEELREGGAREDVLAQIRGALEELGVKVAEPAGAQRPVELGDPDEG